MKRAMQALLISPDPAMRDNCVTGTKVITIREGHRDYTPGPTMLCCEKEPWAVMVDITDVKRCSLADVTEAEWVADGFSSQQNMLDEMRRYYPTITLESPVTVIRWNNARGKYVDRPLVHREHLLYLQSRQRFLPGDKVIIMNERKVGVVTHQAEDFFVRVQMANGKEVDIDSTMLDYY